MLYKFKSKVTGDLILLEPQGRHILTLIGKTPSPRGIIEPNEMLAAIDALHAAVVKEELAHEAAKAAGTKDDAIGTATTSFDAVRSISLKQRVVPFIDMLRRAHAEDKEVVWGV
jgi:Domain of unknown function (DUF1840)